MPFVSRLGTFVERETDGLVFGNRGCLHDRDGAIVRHQATRRWIACRLAFRGRHRAVMPPGRYTGLFFLDEATAFAAGHRPCAECRRQDFNRLKERWGPADAIDHRLEAERGRTHAAPDLPTGAMVRHEGEPHLVIDDTLRRWTPGGLRTARAKTGRANRAHHPAQPGRAAARRLVRRRPAASSQRHDRSLASPRVPTFKAAYLIHGDDHGRIAERRARLRAVAEAESGSAGVEVFEGDASSPDAIAAALSAMTFAVGRRFVIADGVERWKDADTEQVVQALKTIDPETLTVAFFAREEGRYKTPAALAKAVTQAGGVIQDESTVKGRELPKWVQQRAHELGITLDFQAARALIARTGDRQQRLLRELEKIALQLGRGAEPSAEEVDALVAGSSERKSWTLADAVVANDRRAAMRAFVELRGQGERVPGLLFAIARRMRAAHTAAVGLESGESPNQIKRRLQMAPFAADKLISEVRGEDPERFARALELLADLESESRGHGGNETHEDTAAVRMLTEVTR